MTNFIFSRRDMQKCIDRLAKVIDADQLTSIVGKLNKRGDQRLPTMWELVILDALSHVGKLRHEVPSADGSRPDFELETGIDGEPRLLIVGDITAVSDAWLDEQNPVDVLFGEVSKLARKCGLNPNKFGYHVPGERVGSYGDERMKLSIPQRGQLHFLVRSVLKPWVCGVKEAPDRPHRLDHLDGDTRFSLTYVPTQEFASGGYVSYDVALSLDRNPLFGALKSKADQLRHAPDNALRLIVACDGDCALFRGSSFYRSPGTYSAHQIVQDFLRQHSSIDAVLLVGIDEQRGAFGTTAIYKVKYDVLVPPSRAWSARSGDEALASLEKVLRAAAEHVPRPVQTACNAVMRCRERGFGHGMVGAYKMRDNSVRLSSRAIQRLLAGETTPENFNMMHGWDREKGPGNPFSRAIREGRMISATKIEPGGDHDDDWFVFTFGRPDPAISRFVVPRLGGGEG
ncbi:MAG: hypothetical protein EPN36_02280 [Rhodanobacteraceae bacterium]|nr:MAG: hypothetical protein EPN36_02280 [Rhodanobacteraceae bacterium]